MFCTCQIVFLDLNDRDKEDYFVSSVNEKPLLNNQLWEYNKDLGVDAYMADDQDLEGTLKWKLQDHWYTTSQIERIYELRAFL